MKISVNTLLTLVTLAWATASTAQASQIQAYVEPQEARTRSLLPSDILKSSSVWFPDILESAAKARAALGDQVSAQGAFDLVFKSDGFDRATGFWTGQIVNTEVRQKLRPLGAEVYGGYRLSDGTFPIYEDINFTNTGGEIKVGAIFSLLRNRSIDQKRFKIEDARLATTQANLDLFLTQVGVQQKALNAYWRWVAAGRQLSVYQDLLKIAEARAAALAEQVKKGAQPEVAITENLQNIIRREILVAEAERDFIVAGNAVSFYLRDQSGNLIIPTVDDLPNDNELQKLANFELALSTDATDILQNRPELRTLRVAIDRAQNTVRLRENDLKPDLDVSVEVSRDFGSIAEGGISRDSTDTIIGFKFSVPLQRREAKGRLKRAKAELRAIEILEQRTQDQITIELNNILTNLQAALRLANLALNEVVQAEQMVEVERKRLSFGASDFFLVNVREERAADAQIRAIRAELNGRLAGASYNAATMNMKALGL